MGFGDDLLYIRAAELQHKATNKTIKPTRKGRPKVISELWKNITFISNNGELPLDELINTDTQTANWTREYNTNPDYHPESPNTAILNKEDYALADTLQRPFILLCPDPKGEGSHHDINKTWYGWQDLANKLKDYKLIRLTHNAKDQQYSKRTPDFKHYDNVVDIHTNNIRESLAVVEYAELVICTDGFFHHAANYTNTKAIVIWGSCTSHKTLGYKGQLNIYTECEGHPCYTIHKPCEVCVSNMKSITADMIVKCVKNKADPRREELSSR